MAKLVLGPLLRYVGETDAVVWVETDEPCTVEVLGHSEPTFCVAGHHYGLVIVEGLDLVDDRVRGHARRQAQVARAGLGVSPERDPDPRW